MTNDKLQLNGAMYAGAAEGSLKALAAMANARRNGEAPVGSMRKFAEEREALKLRVAEHALDMLEKLLTDASLVTVYGADGTVTQLRNTYVDLTKQLEQYKAQATVSGK